MFSVLYVCQLLCVSTPGLHLVDVLLFIFDISLREMQNIHRKNTNVKNNALSAL